MDKPKAIRGFAAMTPEMRSAISKKGGHSVPDHKRSFSTNRELAVRAGRVGGQNYRATVAVDTQQG